MSAIQHENGSIAHDATTAIEADRDVKCLIDHPSLNSKAETVLESVNVMSLKPPDAIVRACALVQAVETLLSAGLIDEALLTWFGVTNLASGPTRASPGSRDRSDRRHERP